MADRVKNPSLYRALHHLRKNKLHEALHVPAGEPIPAEKLSKAEKSDSPHLQKMATLARTMKSWHH